MQNELEKEQNFKEVMDKLNSEIEELKNKNVLKFENETLKKDSEKKMKNVKAANEAMNKYFYINFIIFKNILLYITILLFI